MIHDEFTNLDVSRQRKYQLRHPEKRQAYETAYRQSAAGKNVQLRANRKYRANRKAQTVDNSESLSVND